MTDPFTVKQKHSPRRRTDSVRRVPALRLARGQRGLCFVRGAHADDAIV